MAEIETIARGDDSRLIEPRRFLIRDRQAFNAIWAAHAGEDAVPPAVDFATRMVAAVFAGERPSAGFAIDVTGTRRDGSALVVLVEERQPDPAGVAAQIIASPFHVVTLPRDDGEIRFNVPDPVGNQTIVFKAPSTIPSASLSAALDETQPLAPRPIVPRSVAAAPRLDERSSFTGLTPRVAASLAYLAGPFSGALLLATEPTSRFVRFHAWQAVLGLGTLGVAAVVFLGLAFVLLIVSPTAFWTMLWLAAATGVAWVVVWALCLVNAYRGRELRLPVAGDFAERRVAAQA